MLYTDRPYKMKIVASLLLLAALAVLGNAYNFNVDVGKSLAGKVIHVESLRYRGMWLKPIDRHGRWLGMGSHAEADVYYNKWTHFKVIGMHGGVVGLSPVGLKNYFCDAYRGGRVGMAFTTYPFNKSWAKWRIRCTSSDMSNCVIESVKYRNEYFDSSHDHFIYVTRYGSYYSRFRILAPKPSAYYKSVLSTENNSGSSQKKSLTMYEGTSDTTTTSNTVTTSVSAEVQAAFVTASASITHEWQQVNTKTYDKQRTIHYDITIPPYTKIDIKQLTGSYGPFSVRSSKFKIDETSTRSGKKSSFSRNLG